MATKETVKQINSGGVLRDVEDVGARQLIASLRAALDAITSGDTTTAIKTFNEIIAFLDNIEDTSTLQGIIAGLNTAIAAKYTKPGTGIPASDLAQAVQTILNNVANKVDAVPGKGLSTNDFTTAEKTKLAGIAEGAQVNVINGIQTNDGTLLTPQNGIVTLPYVDGSGIDMSKPLDILYNNLLDIIAALSNSAFVSGIPNVLSPFGQAAVVESAGTLNHCSIQRHSKYIPYGSDIKIIITPESGYTLNGITPTISVANGTQNITSHSYNSTTGNYEIVFNGVVKDIDVTISMTAAAIGGNTPTLLSPTNNSSVDVGTSTGSGVTKSITVKGSNLTKQLSVSVSGNGFSVSPSTISAADANEGTTITVTYNGTDTSASGTLLITSDEVSASVTLSANYESGSVEPPVDDEITYPDDFNLDTRYSVDGGIVTEVSSQGLCTNKNTRLIPVTGGHTIKASFGRKDPVGPGLVALDSNGNYINGYFADNNGMPTISLPSNAAFIKCVFKMRNIAICAIVDLDPNVENPIIWHGPGFSAFAAGKFIGSDASGYVFAIGDDSNYTLSGYIPVTAGAHYDIVLGYKGWDIKVTADGVQYNPGILWLDANKFPIQHYWCDVSKDVKQTTAPAGAAYAVCTFLTSALDNCYILNTDNNTYGWKGNNVQ